jgi:hypothetical protein
MVEGGKYRVMRPVCGCNKEWAATDLDQAREWCDSLFDHTWQREYTEYGKNEYGIRIRG